MSKLNVDQKSIFGLFSDRKADFLIPDYQRPYAWETEQCQILWDDVIQFCFPDNTYQAFNENEEYFLGAIVTFKNNEGKSEVIDGQQRLTTLMLMLRAFYDKFSAGQDGDSKAMQEKIEKCIWKLDSFDKPKKNELKIKSEVATDEDSIDFLAILNTGKVETRNKSKYLTNYNFFLNKIDEFIKLQPSYFAYLPARILDHCILLPIEATSQDTALRIFSTLNDRGLPLADADIFKAQLYKYYKEKNEKESFITEWEFLHKISSSVFFKYNDKPMNELFSRYMYYLRAQERVKNSTTLALRSFYEKDEYKYLKRPNTLKDLKILANFWDCIERNDGSIFNEDINKKLFVLRHSPNSMWHNLTSVYFLKCKLNDEGDLDQARFSLFLSKVIAFTFTYAITNPGVNALRTPVYEAMIHIIDGEQIRFPKFDEERTRKSFENFTFLNQRAITRSLLTWYAFSFPEQQLLDHNEALHIEHIYPKKRYEMEKTENGLKEDILESLGNKVLLEESINISASDYRFDDKKRIYKGEQRRGKNKEASKIYELSIISDYLVFNEDAIVVRNNAILDRFFEMLRAEELI
jgi:uncharacterized protein with ParB-like and HNH nuclease domain